MIKYPSNRIGKTLCGKWKFLSIGLVSSGAQGEYAGLRVIRAYHEHKGAPQRKVGRMGIVENEFGFFEGLSDTNLSSWNQFCFSE